MPSQQPMQLEMLRMAIALLGLFIASITDLRTREVPDWISFGLIFSGLGLNTIAAATQRSILPLASALLATAILYGVARLLYAYAHFGGGDAKLLTALGALFGNTPIQHLPGYVFLPMLIINILVIGSFYGMLFAFGIAIKHRSACLQAIKQQNNLPTYRKMKRWALIIIVPLAIILNLLSIPTPAKIGGNALLLLLLIYPYIQILAKAIEVSSLTKAIPPSKLTPGDWVVEDVKKGARIIAHASPEGIDERAIAAIKRAKIVRTKVRYGIPFVPAFFLATLYTFIRPEIVLFGWP